MCNVNHCIIVGIADVKGVDTMTEKRFYIRGIGISDRERKRLYDLKTVDGFISVRDLLNEQHEEKEELIDALNQRTEQCDKLHEENKQLKKLADGNEEQLLKVMSYLHDKYYELWEEVNKECFKGDVE